MQTDPNLPSVCASPSMPLCVRGRMTPAAFAFLKAELGIRNLANVPVHHCPFAFAAVIDAAAGWRLVYSGDTRPCERLVQVGGWLGGWVKMGASSEMTGR